MPREEELFNHKSFFKEAIEKDKLASGYLFVGDDHLKKREIALFIAKALNCQEALIKEDCLCENCLKIDSFNHPDVVWVRPASSQKLKIDNVRTVIRQLYLKPYEGKYKVFIVEEADTLTEEAQNAFLKTLEEPPKNSVIILLASQKESLLETIISRCQIIKFLLSSQKGETDLKIKNYLLNKDRIKLLAEFTQGMERQELDRFLNSLLIWFRDALIYINGKQDLCFNKDDLATVGKLASKYSPQKLEDVLKEIMHLRSLVVRNVNPRIATSLASIALEE